MTKRELHRYAFQPAPDEIDALQVGARVFMVHPMRSHFTKLPLPFVKPGDVEEMSPQRLFVSIDDSWRLGDRTVRPKRKRILPFWRGRSCRGWQVGGDVLIVPATAERMAKVAEWKRREEAMRMMWKSQSSGWYATAPMEKVDAVIEAIGGEE